MSNKETQTLDVILNPDSIGSLAEFEEKRQNALASQGSDEPISFESVLHETQYGGEVTPDSNTGETKKPTAYDFVANQWMGQELGEQDEVLDSATKRVRALGSTASVEASEYVVKVLPNGDIKGIYKSTKLKPTRAWDTTKMKTGTTPRYTGKEPIANHTRDF